MNREPELTLRERYEAWAQQRARYSETDCTEDGPTSSEWQYSDDEAVAILEEVMAKLDALANGMRDAWPDVGCRFNCGEAEIVYEVLRIGDQEVADVFMSCHADEDDDETDIHEPCEDDPGWRLKTPPTTVEMHVSRSGFFVGPPGTPPVPLGGPIPRFGC